MLVLEVPEAESGVERARRRDDPGAGRQRAPGPGTALARVEQPAAVRVGGEAHGLAATELVLRDGELPQQGAGGVAVVPAVAGEEGGGEVRGALRPDRRPV